MPKRKKKRKVDLTELSPFEVEREIKKEMQESPEWKKVLREMEEDFYKRYPDGDFDFFYCWLKCRRLISDIWEVEVCSEEGWRYILIFDRDTKRFRDTVAF